MAHFRRPSIRLVLGVLLGTMATMLVGLSTTAMIDAGRRAADASGVAQTVEASRQLFNMLLATRMERGNENIGLFGENSIPAANEELMRTFRARSEQGFNEAMKFLASADDDKVAKLIKPFVAAHDALSTNRIEADKAIHQRKADRPAGVGATYSGSVDSVLSALIALSDHLESSMKLNDSVLSELLLVKRASWLARLNLGMGTLQIEAIVSAAKPYTTADLVAASQIQARVSAAWELMVSAAATSATPKPLADAIAAATPGVVGPGAESRRAMAEALAAGQGAGISLKDLQANDTILVTTAGAVPTIALDQMVERAHGLAEGARDTVTIDAAILIGALLLSGAGFAVVWLQISRPLKAMTQTMRTLAAGDTSVEIPGIGRGDEIGGMADAVAVFRENAVQARLQEQEQKAASERRLAEDEQLRRATEEAAAAESARIVVESIGKALEQLAEGNLTYRVDATLPPAYEKLCSDLNHAMEQLQNVIRGIVISTEALRNGTNEISHAADDLSRRTEQQAASLEETAAALDEITATVRKTADGATHAQEVVAKTRADAQDSGAVVTQAVAAMDNIKQSSNQITHIIGVIDEIAFQTNLLALNAGVEAARAGDAGRGFAVVASEVRALAQRSADAAKEIKGLISTSAQYVVSGVKLVGDTGEALGRIVGRVAEITTIVSEIAGSAQEQSSGLAQVNTAINQMDQVTQQNAAMVEESTAATHALAGDTEELARLTAIFQTGVPASPVQRPREAAAKPVKSKVATLRPAKTATAMKVVAQSRSRGSSSALPVNRAETWEEF